MSFPAYPKYKDSGVEWLGEVPEHWDVRPLKRLALLKAGAGFPHEEQGVSGEALPFYKVGALGQVADRDALSESENSVSRETARRLRAFVFPPGTIVLAKIGAALMLSRLRLLSREACIDNNMMGVVPAASTVDGGFLRYSMQLVRFDLLANPGAVPSLSEGALAAYPLPIPSVPEQHALLAFLDRETAKIDTLVAEQQRLIALLKEKRQAVISQAVTKGLNLDAPMKPSGIEWLGEVPEHWKIMPVRKVAQLESGHTPSRTHPEYWQNCTAPWFTLADVWQIREAKADYVFETKEKVSVLGLANSSARMLPKGTVILSRTASVGYSAIMGIDMATTQDFANWVCGPRLLPEFLLYVFRSMGGEFERLMMGSTHNTIYMPDVQSLCFALPPMTEQAEVVEYARFKAREFDELAGSAQRAIALLQERRAALISAAVTGKIDVRGLVDAAAA